MDNTSIITELVAGLPEIYQPIFGHPELSIGVSRKSDDRLGHLEILCHTMEDYLNRPPRVLDLGCAQGYFSLRLAAWGADVTGLDNLQSNVDVCQMLADENPNLKARFSYGNIEENIQEIAANQYDLVLGFSVFHHLVHHHGADTVAGWLGILAEKTVCGVFELALQSEPLYWAAAQPADERELLRNFAFVHELGRHPTHLSDITRPLLFASNRVWYLNNEIHAFEQYTHQSHALAADVHAGTRRYYFCQDVLVKHFRLVGASAQSNLKEIEAEHAILSKPPAGVDFLPKLIAFGTSERDSWLVRENVPGRLLLDLMVEGKPYEGTRIIGDVLDQLSALESAGLFHNDVRSWNVLIDDEGKATLIDYGAIGTRREDCVWPQELVLSFFIFTHEVATGKCNQPLPQRQPFISPYNLPEPYFQWARAVWERPKNTWTFTLLRRIWRDALSGQLPKFEKSNEEAWMAAIERHLWDIVSYNRHLELEMRTLIASSQASLNEDLALVHTITAREQKLGAEIQAQREHAQQLEKEWKATQAMTVELGTRLQPAQNEIQRITETISTLEQELGAQILQEQQEIAQLFRMLAAREQELGALLQASQQEMLNLSQALAEREHELAQHQLTITEQTTELQGFRQTVLEHDGEIAQLRAQFEQIINLIDVIQIRLTQFCAPVLSQKPPPSITTSRSSPSSLKELLSLQGQDFVVHTYRIVLGREPDPDGLQHHLSLLRQGLIKLEIVRCIRYSSEGKRVAIAVPGLPLELAMQRLYRLPLVGRLFHIANSLFNLPTIEKTQRAFECQYSLEMERTRLEREEIHKQFVLLHESLIQFKSDLDISRLRYNESLAVRSNEKIANDGMAHATPNLTLERCRPENDIDELIQRMRTNFSRFRPG